MSGRDDRGSATVEMVLLMPVLVGFLLLIVVVGRMTDAKSDIIAAASDAARAASLQASAGAAIGQAQAAAEDTVAGEHLNCTGGGPTVQAEFLPSGFARGATVHVTVSCTVNVSDLTGLVLGDTTLTISEQAWEPIDQHRSL